MAPLPATASDELGLPVKFPLVAETGKKIAPFRVRIVRLS